MESTHEWEVQGYYGKQYGWERLTTEDSWKDAVRQKACYDENEAYPHRIKKRKT